ncbi:MAG TPA: histidinol-phosphate transaminase, partial [Coriobacteriia bacterium]|nr:histidinol-phosphate transaminase [Coriobacteriia bacterium]
MAVPWDEIIRPELAPLVPYAPGLRASQVRERSGKDVVLKLSSNEHPCGPVPLALLAMETVLPRLNRYPDGAAVALRRKLAGRLDVPLDVVAVSNGSNEMLRLIAQAVLRPGDEVVFAWPSFVVYPMVTALFGATGVRVPLAAGDIHDLDAMLATITLRTRIVFLCNPNNPTGTIYTKEEFERFMAAVPEHVLVVVDEAYFEFATNPEYPDASQWFDGIRPLVVARTFSKIYSLAGIRVGYAVMPAKLADAINKVREPFNVNTVAQIGAYYSLDDEEEVARRREENRAGRELLSACFGRLGMTYAKSVTNFVYVHSARPRELFEALLNEGV